MKSKEIKIHDVLKSKSRSVATMMVSPFITSVTKTPPIIQ